jgi:AAT family amino acid transporter
MPPPTDHGKDTTLRQSLSTAQLTMIAIGGAIGTGLFLGSGFAIHLAGPSVLLSYAIGAFIGLLLMGSLAEMAAAQPATGSFGLYAEQYLSPFAGFAVRYSYWVALALAMGTEVAAVAIYMRYWMPAIPGWVWILVFSAVLIAINALQVGAFGAVEYGFSLLKVLAICGFLLLGGFLVLRTPHISASNLTAHGGLLPHGVKGMWQAVVVSLFSYFSLEMIAIAAAEARDPRAAVVRAFRGTIARLVLFYLGTIAIILALAPWNAGGSGIASSPFVRVMQSTSIPYAAGILNFIVLTAALSAMNSQLYTASRMMYSLSHAGFAPVRFGRLTHTGVPVAALAISSLGIAIAFIVQALSPVHAFTVMMSTASFGVMFAWLMIFLTHLAFRRKYRGALPFRVALYPITPALGAVLMLALLLTTAIVPGFQMTLVFGLPFLALLAVVYFGFLRRKPRPTEPEPL